MVTLLISSVVLLSLFAIAIYFWQKAANKAESIELPPMIPARGLFEHSGQEIVEPSATNVVQVDPAALLARANAGEKDALDEAHQLAPEIYNEVLDSLIAHAQTSDNLLGLVSYLSRHNLPVNENCVQAFIETWKRVPDKNGTSKVLHLAALSDNADVYRQTVELVLSAWREGKLEQVSALELQALFNGEFWVLSTSTRNSGAGFLLKRTLSSARRELEVEVNN